MFEDVDLNISFPNLTLLSIDFWTNDPFLLPFLLPDLSECEHLQELSLAGIKNQLISFQSRLEDKVLYRK